MTNKNIANDSRTKLLLKTETEIEKFTKSNVLINTITPLNIYNSYCNIQINLESTEFSIVERKESQKKFYDDTNIEKTKVDFLYMDVFKKINKIIISDKKNKTFYDRLKIQDNEIKLNKNINLKSSTPNLFSKTDENKINQSIKILREKAKNLINIILRRKNQFKNNTNSFYSNSNFKSHANLKIIEHKKKKNTINFKNKLSDNLKFENPIIEDSSIIYSSNIHEKKISTGICYYNKSIFKNVNIRKTNIVKNNKICKLCYTSFNSIENKVNNNEKKFEFIADKINPFIKYKINSKITENKN
jgi:hypothetical protein